VIEAIQAEGVDVADIGRITKGSGVAIRETGSLRPLPHPERDSVAVVLEKAWREDNHQAM
jgi:hypothetical protein